MNNLPYILYPNVRLESEVVIGEYSVIGKPTRPRVSEGQFVSEQPGDRLSATTLGMNTTVGTHVLIEQGAQIGKGCVIEARSVIEADVTIGDRSFVVHGARICAGASIGAGCVIGGFVAERSQIGPSGRVFGSLVHRQFDPTRSWDDYVEPAPVLEEHVFVAMAAVIIGAVRLASHVYVIAGAVVTKDVPSFHVAHGVNCFVPFDKWKGRLVESQFWR